MEAQERFLQYVKEAESGCHEWQSTIKKDGYGQFWYDGKNMRAHRAAYILLKGKIPKGKFILHKCDNRCCVNLEHLYVGTQKDNVQDMYRRGRNKGHRTVDVALVKEIRRLYKEGGCSQQQIADIYDLKQPAVSKIILRKTWSKI